MATEILGHTLTEWEPMPPQAGPPLPSFLNIYWPWYKPTTPPPVGSLPLTLAVVGFEPYSDPSNLGQALALTVFVSIQNPNSVPVTHTVNLQGYVDGRWQSRGWSEAPGVYTLQPTAGDLLLTIGPHQTVYATSPARVTNHFSPGIYTLQTPYVNQVSQGLPNPYLSCPFQLIDETGNSSPVISNPIY